jgi:hypothetical protein
MARTSSQEQYSSSGRILFKFHPLENTTEGETYIYLLRNNIWNADQGKSLANEAIVAFWFPYARQKANPELARETALYAINQLEAHIAKLRRDFSIPAPEMLTQALPVSVLPATTVHSIPQPTTTTPDIGKAGVDNALYGTFDVFED